MDFDLISKLPLVHGESETAYQIQDSGLWSKRTQRINKRLSRGIFISRLGPAPLMKAASSLT